ncbi:MAG: ATP-grasp domain-containing protein [Phycisphaerae bacterium]|nr:ATP-grasp domain-containing protein [Phycisphaerae bacterium]
MKPDSRILIAGIGGASLGMEIFKCLRLAGGYSIFGCDISELAFGHFAEGFAETVKINRDRYIQEVVAACRKFQIQAIIPGGEEPMVLLSEAAETFRDMGVHIACNAPEVVFCCSNKERSFIKLQELGLPVPATFTFGQGEPIDEMAFPLPCVVKPVEGTGGSALVFLASTHNEAVLYARYILKMRRQVMIQEYLPLDEGEFTVGVLSLPTTGHVGVIAMQRIFHNKLSVAIKTEAGLISSGYSQGRIDTFPDICQQCRHIAEALGNAGPMNIQGRVRNGQFVPFEINPRFSASTYLRAMAGFNEVDLFLRYILFENKPSMPTIRPGYYLRSFNEVGVEAEGLQS